MIYCPNPSCQTPNPETHRFCQVCRTALPHRYLWAVGQDLLNGLKPGDLAANRYQLKRGRIFLDTKPGIPPESIAEIPDSVFPYLHLSIYPLQIPRPYCVLSVQQGRQTETVLLLEEAAIRTDFGDGDMLSERTIIPRKTPDDAEITTEFFPARAPASVQLLPTLQQDWESATALRQLNWLWQIAKLWRHFQLEQVATSLITPELLRVDGSILRLLELSQDPPDPQLSLTLKQLGQSWKPLIQLAQPTIAPFLQQLCQQLCQDQFKTAEQLVDCLDAALDACSQGQKLEYKLVTYTDQGPTRQRNEDACFPPSGAAKTYAIEVGQSPLPHPVPLLIVCDGIGGHESGDVASKLAIEVIHKALQPLLKQASPDPTTLMVRLEREICAANDAISQRNDREQRSARERMGTTLVMGFLHGYEFYLAHIGDSRAYRISPFSCRQATLDDDVATREVRLGYGFYRDALQQPGAGSLVQALGMGSSQSLYPTVQRFILDEDSVFLLCSDGLSDNDQVETFWPTEILPVLQGQQTLTRAGRRLIEVANTYNGHDNVTVGLIQIKVIQSSPTAVPPELAIPKALLPPKLAQKSAPAQTAPAQSTLLQSPPAPPTAAPSAPAPPAPPPVQRPFPQPVSNQPLSIAPFPEPAAKRQPLWPLLLGILLLLLIGGGMAFLIFWFGPPVAYRDGEENPSLRSAISPSPTPNTPLDANVETPQFLEVNSYIQIRRSTANGPSAKPLILQRLLDPSLADTPPVIEGSETIDRMIPAGGILKILDKREEAEVGPWVKLELCSNPTESTPELDASNSFHPSSEQPLQLGEAGWILEKDLVSQAAQVPADAGSIQEKNCSQE